MRLRSLPKWGGERVWKMYSIDTIRNHLEQQYHLPNEQVEVMLPSFIKTLSNHMVDLHDALAQGDLLLLGRAGHTIKGAFLNLGLDECAQLALRIEQSGKAGDASEDYKRLIRQISTRVAPVLQAL